MKIEKIIMSIITLFTLCSLVWADPGDELLHAVDNGNLTEVKRLLDAGVDINHQSYNGSALLNAVYDGHIEIIELLIEAGADLNLQ